MEIDDVHWMFDILQSIDVGVVVLDREYRIELWNSFMESHSALEPDEVQGQSFFRIFPELDQEWFRSKVETVAMLGTRSFTIWEQRPYLVKFKNYQPITGQADFMFQNATFIPVKDARGQVAHVCLVIYDVTHEAVHKLQLQNTTAKLHSLTRTDALSGLHNRAYWDQCLAREFARQQRYQRELSLLLVDIDGFQAFNTQHQHKAGDRLIQALAGLIQHHVRSLDWCGRYGPDQFALLLPDTLQPGAALLAERLREECAALRLEAEGQKLQCTVSIGVTTLDLSCASPLALCAQAEQALRQAKSEGGNRVILAGC